jgi:hypothetical protein
MQIKRKHINNIKTTLEIFILTKTEYILKRSSNKINRNDYFYCGTSKKLYKNASSNSIKGNVDEKGNINFQNEKFHFEINEKDLTNYTHRKI